MLPLHPRITSVVEADDGRLHIQLDSGKDPVKVRTHWSITGRIWAWFGNATEMTYLDTHGKEQKKYVNVGSLFKKVYCSEIKDKDAINKFYDDIRKQTDIQNRVKNFKKTTTSTIKDGLEKCLNDLDTMLTGEDGNKVSKLWKTFKAAHTVSTPSPFSVHSIPAHQPQPLPLTPEKPLTPPSNIQVDSPKTPTPIPPGPVVSPQPSTPIIPIKPANEEDEFDFEPDPAAWDNYGEVDDDLTPIAVQEPVTEPALPRETKEYQLANGLKTSKYTTYKALEILQKKDLDPMGKTYGKAIDNGDCFWDSFAQALNQTLGEKVDVKELRKIVSKKVNQPNQDSWLKGTMKNDSMETQEEYKKYVFYTSGELDLMRNSKEHESRYPVFGTATRDGKILCDHYQVNLQVYMAEPMIKEISSQKELDNPLNYGVGKSDFIKIDPNFPTIEIVQCPGHFMPIIKKSQ